MKKIKHYIKLLHNFLFHNPDRSQTLKIILLSGWYWTLISIVPIKRLEQRFGLRGEESPYKEDPIKIQTAYRIGKRVERICKRTPWTSKCLVRALTAQHLICKKKIATTLYLGVQEKDNSMLAHAWLRCENYIITGGDGFSSFNEEKGCLPEGTLDYSIVACFKK